MDYKKETLHVYDAFPEYFDEKFGKYTNEIIKEELQEVILLLPKKSKILDLGSGPGNHAVVLQKNGFEVLCFDNSPAMLKKCKEKGLATIKMDLEKLDFPAKSFDAVWAYTSLLHIPKKNISSVLDSICKVLKDKGHFFLSSKEGTYEGFVPFEKGGQRWFSFYTDQEIRTLLKKDFTIIKHWRVPLPGKNKAFLDYFCQKR